MRFNEKYKIYLDIGDGTGYNEILAAKVSPFNYEREDGQYFWRYKWGEVTFSNNPKTQSELSSNKYLGYNLIAGVDGFSEIQYPDEIKIKYEDSQRSFEGYFSHKDCEFKSGKHFKTITVKPAILDQYTPLLENWEEKVGIIGGEITANGFWKLRTVGFDYNQFNNHTLPITLSSSNIPSAKGASDDVGATLTHNKFIYNTNKGYILNVTVSAKAKNISGSGVYTIYLKKYDSNLNEIDSSILVSRGITTDINTTNFSGEQTINLSTGQSAALLVEMEIGSLDYTSINVSVSGNPINVTTKEVKVQFNDNDLKHNRIWAIDSKAYKLIKTNDNPDLVDYFENAGSEIPFAPKASMFGSKKYGMQERGTRLYLYQSEDQSEGLVDILGEEDWELSEVTVWRGDTIRKWFHKETYFWCTCLFSREEKETKNDSNNLPVPPDNAPDTWHLRKSDPDGKIGYTLWTRKPYNGEYTEWILGDEIIADGDPYVHNGSFKWANKLTSKRKYPTTDTVESFRNAIDLYTLIKYIYNNTAYPSGDVKSTFLWNDYEENMPIITQTGNNYVTNFINFFNLTAVLPTLTLRKNIDTTEENSKLELSFKDFMEDFRNYFKVVGQGNLYWFIQWNTITEQYDLRIEHIKFLDKSTGIYTTTNLIEDSTYKKYLEETYNYSFDDSDMFKKITIETVNSGYKGFKKNEVSFKNIVSNTRNKDLNLEHQTKIFSTDIQFARENPSDLENGLIWLNIDANDEIIRDKTSSKNTNEMPNGYFAISNLIEIGLLKYEGVWETGNINGVGPKEFENTLRNLMCEDFSIPGLHSSEFFQTGIGLGMTESLELDPERQITKLKLAFRKINSPAEITLKSGTTTSLDGFYLMVQKESDFDGADNIYFSFGNYET